MTKLAGIFEEVFDKTGFFMTHQPLQSSNNYKGNSKVHSFLTVLLLIID